MLTLRDINKFIKTIEECTARELSKPSLVNKFLNFMNDNFSLNRKYFDSEYEKNKENYNNFEDFICKYYLRLEKDLRRNYEYFSRKAKEREKYYKEKVAYFNKKIEEKENDKYEKKKYQFFLQLSMKYHDEAKNGKKKKNVFYRAYSNSIINSFESPFSNNLMLDFNISFVDLEQFEETDWKSIINFGYAPVYIAESMKRLKRESPNEYLICFEKYICNEKIFQQLEEVLENNYYLADRIPIIKAAANFFDFKNYIPLVYLLVPQVEGLFDIYRQILDIDVEEKINGLCDKLAKIRKEKKIVGYIYYAFTFPRLRNEIAHGKMIKVTKEMAFEIIMDIFHIVMLIDSNDNAYKIWITFLKDLLEKKDKINYVLEIFKNNSIYKEQYLKILEDYLDGKYNDIIKWYGLENNEKTFVEIVKSEAFRKKIFDNESIKKEEKKLINGEECKVVSIDKDVCQYKSMIQLLQKKDFFPTNWVLIVEKKMKEIEEEKEKLCKCIKSKEKERIHKFVNK